MKVNQKQRRATRKKIIQAAVGVMIEKGVKSATMREIAKLAGIGDATIYNYFPTKEAIIYGYYEDSCDAAVEQVNRIEGFAGYTLQEQLQSLLETMLTQFLADREFIQTTFTRTFITPGPNQARTKSIRKRFFTMVQEILYRAEANGDIPEMVFGDITSQMFWDYYLAIVAYWLKDQSDQFTDTTVLVDLSLDLACAMLKSGLLNKAFSMASFLFKTHVLSRMDLFTEQIATINRMKRQFMGDDDEDE